MSEQVPPDQEGMPPETAESVAAMREQLAALPASEVVAQLAAQLVAFAYVRLGIPPEQNQQYRDLDAARLLIDAFAGILSATEGQLGPVEPEFRQVLAALRMGYTEIGRQEAQRPSRKDASDGEPAPADLHVPPSGLWVPGQE